MNFDLIVQRRLPYYSDNIPFIVSYSQKSGCTSVLKWFLHHAGVLNDALNYESKDPGLDIHSYEMKVFKNRPRYKQDVVAHLKRGKPVIAFLRCPFQRAWSSYLHIHNRFYITQERRGIESPGLRLRSDILTHIYGEKVSTVFTISFLDYLKWLDTQDLAGIDPHHGPQTSEINKHHNIRYYRLEEFNRALSNIENTFELPDSSKFRSRFSSGHHNKKQDLPSHVVHNIFERGLAVNLPPEFSVPRVKEETLKDTECGQLVRKIFKDDIALYRSIRGF